MRDIRAYQGFDEAGFTLVEVLISLFIFALISVGTMTALTQSLQGKSRLDMAVAEINTVNSARAILRADMSTLTLRISRDELGGQVPFSLTTDGEAVLTFIRRGRLNPGGLEKRGDLERVEYHFNGSDFIRRSFMHVNISSDPEYFDRVLLTDLSDISVKAHRVSARTSIAGAASNVSEFFRVSALPNIETTDKPAALSFELTDESGHVTEHFFELDI